MTTQTKTIYQYFTTERQKINEWLLKQGCQNVKYYDSIGDYLGGINIYLDVNDYFFYSSDKLNFSEFGYTDTRVCLFAIYEYGENGNKLIWRSGVKQ